MIPPEIFAPRSRFNRSQAIRVGERPSTRPVLKTAVSLLIEWGFTFQKGFVRKVNGTQIAGKDKIHGNL
jgi:hypothetical protein